MADVWADYNSESITEMDHMAEEFFAQGSRT
jgi:hypothetical protein